MEKENLDREKELAGEEGSSEEVDGTAGSVKSSVVLIGDLEDLRQKVDRYQKRREDSNVSELNSQAEAVVECYRCVLSYGPK